MAGPVYPLTRYQPASYRIGDETRTISQILHLDGVDFDKAPEPPSSHECWAQTIVLGDATEVDFPSLAHTVHRCPCNGMRVLGDPYLDAWHNRNSRTNPNPVPVTEFRYPEGGSVVFVPFQNRKRLAWLRDLLGLD